MVPGSPEPYHFSETEVAEFAQMSNEILATGILSLGPYTELFEQAYAREFGAAFAVAVSTGTSALEIIFRIVGVRDRAVVVPTNTNYATAVAALNAGARVELADGGPWLEPRAYAALLDDDVAAVAPVHIGGYIQPDLDELLELSRERGVRVVEDAAHAHGASLRGRYAGTFGVAGAFSFAQSKVMTLGEGGMILTDQAETADQAREYRNQGKIGSEVHRVWGNSWRLTELQAAVGLVRLRSLAKSVRRRQDLMTIYGNALAGSGLTVHGPSGDMKPSGYKCIVELPDSAPRAEFARRLHVDHGISFAHGVYNVPLHRQPLLKGMTRGRSFPLADRFADQHVCVPLDPGMSEQDAIAIASAIREVSGSL